MSLKSSSTIENDAAIAQALARDEQEKIDESLARGIENNNNNNSINPNIMMNGFPGQRNNHASPHSASEGSAAFFPPQPPQQPQQQQQPLLSESSTSRAHLCMAPCVIGKNNVCVEMLVDTGAQSSVMSVVLARQLGLYDRIDRRHQGIAAGVGRARILGQIRDVVCEIGQVEFAMSYLVLDISDKLLLLGLDLMRRYKCIVDLEKNRLVFGGEGGVSVDLLPPSDNHLALRNQLEGCAVM